MYKERWQSIVALVLGVYVLVSPWLIPYFLQGPVLDASSVWGLYLAGVAVIIVAAFAILSFRLWEAWVQALLGLWIVIAPWVLGFASTRALTWNSVIVGIVLIVISLGSLKTDRMQST